MRKWLSAIVATMALVGSTASSHAAPVICGPRDTLVEGLSQTYQEKRDWIGLTSGGMIMELFVSGSGSWTMIMSSPAGTSCIISAGEHWERARPSGPEV